MTFSRRQTACGMRHCFARRIVECSVRRKLGCTTTRLSERHPQGVCSIRKAAEPPTAAQQRIIGAETNRIAASNAATPRYGQCNRQALQLFELLACNVGTFLLDGHTARFLSTERKWGVWCCGAHAAFPPPPETGGDISAPFGAEKRRHF